MDKLKFKSFKKEVRFFVISKLNMRLKMEEETNENKETPEVPKESIEPEAEPVKPEEDSE